MIFILLSAEGLDLDFPQVDIRLFVAFGGSDTTYGRTKTDFNGQNNIGKDF